MAGNVSVARSHNHQSELLKNLKMNNRDSDSPSARDNVLGMKNLSKMEAAGG